MSNLIVALVKKPVVCEKKIVDFITFERIDLKHSESDILSIENFKSIKSK